MAQTVPYLTEQQIRNNYAKALSDYTNQRNAEADRARTQVNNQYDNAQRQNYVNYMQNRRDLPEQMARMGVTGGASETSALRAQTNYENNFNNAERSRGTEIGNINNTLADTLNTYRMTADQNMNDEIAQNRQLRANYEKQLQQENEQRFANTISGYDNIAGIDNLIASINKSGVDTWRIPYLRARRAELVAAQQAAVASGGGGGGYYYGGYSGGGGNDDATASQPTTQTWQDRAVALANQRRGQAVQGLNSRISNGLLRSGTKQNSTATTSRTTRSNSNTVRNSYRNSKKASDYRYGRVR